MREFTTAETMVRVWETEEIRKLTAKRAVYVANEWRRRELDELWVSDPEYQKTASFGRNTGFYVGMDAIRGYYVDKHLAEMGDGKGYLSNHPMTTSMIRLAEDGKTARGLWYSIAQETRPNGDGTAKALWTPEKIAVDYVREEDGWKIWHIMIANDLVCEAGGNFEEGSVYVDYATDPVAVEFGEPTIPMLAHDQTFNWWDNYPAMPVKYDTWKEGMGYGPDGYPKPERFQWGAKGGRNYK